MSSFARSIVPARSTSLRTEAPIPTTVDPPWGRYAAGVVRTLAERGREAAGIEATITSTIPLGGGLSSSAALEVAVALALCDAARLLAADARACAGVPGSGDRRHRRALRDHGPARLARRQSRPGVADRLPQPRDRAHPAAAAARRARDQLGHAAPARRQCVRRAAACLRGGRRPAGPVRAPGRDARAGRGRAACPPRRLGERPRARGRRGARRGRPRDAGAAPRRRATRACATTSRSRPPSSTCSSRSSIEAGALGARLTGAGFGGCVVGVANREGAAAVVETAAGRYWAETGHQPHAFVCRAVDGAGRVE